MKIAIIGTGVMDTGVGLTLHKKATKCGATTAALPTLRL